MKRYYQRLEGGLLEPARVSRRVWACHGDLDRADASQELAGVAAAPRQRRGRVYLRAAEPAAGSAAFAGHARARGARRDRRLFLGGDE